MHAPPRRAAITESVSKDDDITTIIQACFLEIFQKNINKDKNPSWFFSVFLKNILSFYDVLIIETETTKKRRH